MASSATFLIDAESNLGAAMEMMPGMDMGGMESSQQEMPAEEVDHSQHQMPAADTAAVDQGHEGHSMPPSRGS